MRALLSSVLVLPMVLPGGCVGRQEITIRLHSGNEREVKAEAQLQRLLREYDLSPWFFTREVMIESGVVPHSHPVLTLNSRYTDGRDERQLSTFLHEQIHWFLFANANEAAYFAAIDDLREMYPEVPVAPSFVRRLAIALKPRLSWTYIAKIRLIVSTRDSSLGTSLQRSRRDTATDSPRCNVLISFHFSLNICLEPSGMYRR